MNECGENDIHIISYHPGGFYDPEALKKLNERNWAMNPDYNDPDFFVLNTIAINGRFLRYK